VARVAAALGQVARAVEAWEDGLRWPAPAALVSLHDVTPAHGEVVFRAIDHLRRAGVGALTLLVVPDFHRRARLADHPEFCARLRAAMTEDDEVVLHGYHHLADWPAGTTGQRLAASLLTAGEGEFHALDRKRAAALIAAGLGEIEGALGVRPSGFVAPAWLHNDGVVDAVRRAGLDWCEDHWFVYNLRTGDQLLAPAVSLASRDPIRRIGSGWLARGLCGALPRLRTVRLAVHPGDYGHSDLVAAIDRVLATWLPAHPPTTVRAVWGRDRAG